MQYLETHRARFAGDVECERVPIDALCPQDPTYTVGPSAHPVRTSQSRLKIDIPRLRCASDAISSPYQGRCMDAILDPTVEPSPLRSSGDSTRTTSASYIQCLVVVVRPSRKLSGMLQQRRQECTESGKNTSRASDKQNLTWSSAMRMRNAPSTIGIHVSYWG